MTLAPFYTASLPVKLHILASLSVLALAPLQFAGFRKGSTAHRASGYLWLLAMLMVAITSFFIASRFRLSYAGFGLIHLLSGLAVVTCLLAWRAARRGDVDVHRRALVSMTAGFMIAGAFTFLPSRLMHQIVAG